MADLFQKIKDEIPHSSAVQPVQMDLNSEFQFRCHKKISCFNKCCKDIDITLLPYDIARLKRRAGLTSSQWVNKYTMPFAMDAHDMPGLKLSTKPGSSECIFLTAKGCSVYSDRPSACRYYALGNMSVHPAADGSHKNNAVKEIYFVVKEKHCKGHLEKQTQSVGEYRREQGLDKYDEMNRKWRELILKKRSSGPTLGKPSARSLQLFDMCSYDLDNFRKFINSEGFKEVFALTTDEYKLLNSDEDKLLLFACRFLAQVLFGENSIALKPDAANKRMQRRSAAE